MAEQRVPRALAGSEPVAMPTAAANVSSETRRAEVTVTLVVRGDPAPERSARLAELIAASPRGRRHLEPTAAAALAGGSRAAVEDVARAAEGLGLSVGGKDPGSGTVEATASFQRLCELFRVAPVVRRGPHGPIRSHLGPIHLPPALDGLVEAVLGLDEHPVATPQARSVTGGPAHPVPVLEVAESYDFPEGTGAGQRVAIVELGGGFHAGDLRAACDAVGVAVPRVDVCPVAGGKNDPADPDTVAATLALYRIGGDDQPPPDPVPDSASLVRALWTIETSLDLQVIAALVPAAEIRVYFAPNTSRGKVAAVTTALDDGCRVVSISFGARERGVSQAYVHQMERLLKRSALQGTTVCCASGDSGYLQYPATSPWATACGGSSLHDANGGRVEESVWNEAVPVPGTRLMVSSGGVSDLFDPPAWQAPADVLTKTGVAMRGVPDVAAKADLRAGYRVVCGGSVFATGGTSAAAPLWAGLVARLNQHLDAHAAAVGHLPSLVYREAWGEGLHDITVGRSGVYRACRGWDPCTGMGSPRGRQLLELVMARE